jgi:hypothetical protein
MIKQLGAVPEPVEVTYNNPSVALSSQEFSAKMATWDAADASLKTFAHMAVAAQVGCSWCLDVNYFLAMNRTCCRSPGCGGPTSTARRCATRGHTSSRSSPAKR